jgi:uncharacterized protein YcfJ
MKKLLLISILGLSLNAETMNFTQNVRVSSSNPVYENRVTREPYQECWDQQVSSRQDPGGAIVGGVIGGVLGHQIGGGHGKDIATAGGAILGSIIGSGQTRSQTRIQRNCQTKYKVSSRQRVFVGYNNIGYYKGRKVVKFSNRRLNYIPLHISVSY